MMKILKLLNINSEFPIMSVYRQYDGAMVRRSLCCQLTMCVKISLLDSSVLFEIGLQTMIVTGLRLSVEGEI